MIDWAALEEIDLEVKSVGRMLERVLFEAHELQLMDLSTRSKPGAKAKSFVKGLFEAQDIKGGRFVMESALKEKASPGVIAECMVSQLFNRAMYNISLPKTAFLNDILMLLEDTTPPSCLAVFRGTRNLGLHSRFVPPAGRIAETILAEESQLHSQLRDFRRFENLLKNCARLGF